MAKSNLEIVSIRHQATDRRSKWRKDEAGQVLIALVIVLPILFGIMGLGIDVAAFYSIKRFVQTAADAGAKAGASELQRGSSHGVIVAAAQKDVTSNGYTNAANGATVAVNHPPTSGPHNGDSNFVEVIVIKSQPAFFMRVLLGDQAAAVKGRAVGGLVNNGGLSLGILDPVGATALQLDEGGTSLTVDGGIVINSTSATAISLIGGAGPLKAASIGVVGGTQGCGCVPAVVTGVIPVPDPLASVAPPSFSAGCDHTNLPTITGTQTLSPGRYCSNTAKGAIDISGSANVTFLPGTYVLKGGLRAVGGTLSGPGGVTFYNTFDATYPFKPITMSGANATFVAPSSGIVFFQDRSAPASPQPVNDFSSGSTLNITGALYFHNPLGGSNSQLKFRDGSNITGSGIWTIVVTDRLYLNGGGLFTLKSPVSGGASPLKQPSLVE